MNNFTYFNYTNIVFGKDTEDQVGELTAKMGKKALLHYGTGSIKRSGLYDRVIASLKAAGVEFVELGGVVPNPRLSLVHEGIALCRREQVDCILAVGGGSAIDSAKAIALGVPYEGDVWDFYEGKATPGENVLPLGVVLTIPAAGSETSIGTVITKEEGLLKRPAGGDYLRPQFAILNPVLTYTLPFHETANGVSDMMAHIMERYFTNTLGVDFSDRLCEAAMRSIIHIAPKLKDNPTDYDARADIMWAGCVAHCDILGLGREADWASHDIEHELSGIYDIAHGAGLSIVFPAWIKHVYKDNMPRFVQWAMRVFDVDLPLHDEDAIVLEGVRRLEEFFKQMDLPVRLSDIDIDDTHFEEMAEKAAPVGNFRKLTKEDIVAIYRLAL